MPRCACKVEKFMLLIGESLRFIDCTDLFFFRYCCSFLRCLKCFSNKQRKITAQQWRVVIDFASCFDHQMFQLIRCIIMCF